MFDLRSPVASAKITTGLKWSGTLQIRASGPVKKDAWEIIQSVLARVTNHKKELVTSFCFSNNDVSNVTGLTRQPTFLPALFLAGS
ncbi:hypothetical protein [Atlantibacter hermannii]|uniref:hypothetical protein n=1 Tax=Atlantibacter hermannii TaxID=565 RepID=UPI0018E392C0|nr:hypothetical protein [Atlantibacter hermannii]